jgi:transcriptional regulator with XRE-family HTH domain
MKSFGQKVREARRLLGLTQQQLGDMVGVSKRAVVAYENSGVIPRQNVKRRLAQVLGVSLDYLEQGDVDDPSYGLEKSEYVERTRERFGTKAAREIDFLLERNAALFAGGHLEQDAKDAFFEAVTKAYWAAKQDARRIYGKKNGS